MPHPRVDTETIHHIICDALRATFGVRPRDNGPYFDLFCECTDADVEIEEDDRQDPPEEFDSGLQWYVDTQIPHPECSICRRRHGPEVQHACE